MDNIIFMPRQFLSTLSLRRATTWARGSRVTYVISIHALLAESDRQIKQTCRAEISISIHALLAESDEPAARRHDKNNIFLSTLSLRRATQAESGQRRWLDNFYPRSPCGERRQIKQTCRAKISISIHALLAESDTAG